MGSNELKGWSQDLGLERSGSAAEFNNRETRLALLSLVSTAGIFFSNVELLVRRD
jgi:hypothetical protein